MVVQPQDDSLFCDWLDIQVAICRQNTQPWKMIVHNYLYYNTYLGLVVIGQLMSTIMGLTAKTIITPIIQSVGTHYSQR